MDRVSPVGPDDFPRVVEVWEASVRATHDFVTDRDIEVFRPLVREAIAGEIELSCMRDPEGRVAGFIGVVGDKIEMLFVDPARFGRGIGGRLLEHAVRVQGAVTVNVNEQNERALSFYRRRGFEVAGRSETDGLGKPYPLLHLRKAGS
jgi:putative acetyltransferase